MAYICTSLPALNGAVLPILAGASIVTALVVALAYLLGEFFHNPKITLWAKTEVVQVVVSVACVAFFWLALQGFCSFNFASVAQLFGLPIDADVTSFTMFDAAEGYLLDGGAYIRDILVVARYHLSAYNVLQLRSLWLCESPAWLFCIFGSALGVGGGSGYGSSPESGYAFAAAGVGVAFNSLLVSYISTLNYLFILHYLYSGLILFFLPFGIFLRSMPFLRGLGSLFMALALSFLFVYPSVLAVFYLDLQSNRVLNPEPSAAFQSYLDREDNLERIGGLFVNDFDSALYNDLFEFEDDDADFPGSVEFEIFALSGNAFLIGVFIPSIALLTSIGSVMYLNRFLGQEIDLSRIVQMV